MLTPKKNKVPRVRKQRNKQFKHHEEPPEKRKATQEVKMWWGPFTEYVKMRQHIDLSTMTTVNKIIEKFLDHLD